MVRVSRGLRDDRDGYKLGSEALSGSNARIGLVSVIF
jgi:hypothetical protein